MNSDNMEKVLKLFPDLSEEKIIDEKLIEQTMY